MLRAGRRMKVSVIIASYNHERYVEQAIRSVLAQSFQDFEIILVDDASTDRTFEIAQGIRDVRLTCIRAPKNCGTSTTYNTCLAHARGEYVAVLNSDDFFAPGRLQRQVDLLDAKPGVAAVFSQAQFVDEAGAPYWSLPGGAIGFAAANCSRHIWLRRFFFEGNQLCHPSVMIRRSVHQDIGLYDFRLIQIHDFDLWIRVCLKHDIHVLEEPLINFRVRDNQGNANNTKPGTIARITWEYDHVVRRFLEITGFDEFAQVFPEVTLPRDEWDLFAQRYALAKLALPVQNVAHARLGLELLYGLFGDLGASEVERRFGLPLDWFLRTTGMPELIFRHRPGGAA